MGFGLLAATLDPVQQEYLLEARQMQAMSLAVHIPIVCFGIAFPALVMLVEWLHLRTGNPVYRTLAKRWSKVMLALFAVGVVTGTILSFELGTLWPNFMATFGEVFGLGFALVAGITGSLTVIAVNAWMNNPSGFRLEAGKAVDVQPWSALFGNSYLWHPLDRLPHRVRVDRLDADDPALHRRHRHHPAWHKLRTARRGAQPARGGCAERRVRPLLDPHAVRARRRPRRDRFWTRAGGQRRW